MTSARVGPWQSTSEWRAVKASSWLWWEMAGGTQREREDHPRSGYWTHFWKTPQRLILWEGAQNVLGGFSFFFQQRVRSEADEHGVQGD